MDTATTTIIAIAIKSSMTVLGAFSGAIFAFLFFILGEKYKRRIDRKLEWKKTYKKEHAYLERYLYDLYTTIIDNKKVFELVINSYEKGEIDMGKVNDLPIREDTSMKIDDHLFMNRIETYLNIGLKKINRWQRGLSKIQDKLNEDLLDSNSGKQTRAEKNLPKFNQQLVMLIKYYEYYIDVIDDLMIENKLLLKKYKKWNYNRKKLEETYTKRKKQIADERFFQETEVKNPLLEEQLEKMKKYKIATDSKE